MIGFEATLSKAYAYLRIKYDIVGLILNLETSTEVCSVTLARNGAIIGTQTASDTNQHAELLTTYIDLVIQQAGVSYSDLEAIAVSAGPGSYTSLRVGVSAAKGLCFALSIPLIGIDTLEALAVASIATYSAEPSDELRLIALPMLDARRDEVCMGTFDAEGKKILAFQSILISNNMFEKTMSFLPPSTQKTVLLFSGNGSSKCLNVPFFENVVFSPITACSSAHMAQLSYAKFQSSDFQSVAYFEPIYFKPPAVTTQKKNVF